MTLLTSTRNLSLYCEAEGATSYKWQKHYYYDSYSNIPYYITFTVNTVDNTSELTLINLQPNYAGTYRCLAKNDSGVSYSFPAEVIING